MLLSRTDLPICYKTFSDWPLDNTSQSPDDVDMYVERPSIYTWENKVGRQKKANPDQTGKHLLFVNIRQNHYKF